MYERITRYFEHSPHGLVNWIMRYVLWIPAGFWAFMIYDHYSQDYYGPWDGARTWTAIFAGSVLVLLLAGWLGAWVEFIQLRRRYWRRMWSIRHPDLGPPVRLTARFKG